MKLDLTVTFDTDNQNTDIEFDKKEFKSWSFVRAVLHAAQIVAEHKHNFAMQKAMAQEMQKEQIRQMIQG